MLSYHNIIFSLVKISPSSAVYKAQILRNRLIINQSANGSVDNLACLNAICFLGVAHTDRRMQTHITVSVSSQCLVDGGVVQHRTEGNRRGILPVDRDCLFLMVKVLLSEPDAIW